MSNTDNPAEDLETRVEQLTTIIKAQQQQLDALREAAGVDDEELVSRRSMIQGGASVGAAGLLAALASGSAAASPGADGDTVWGSQNNRDDWYADFIDANTVQTAELGNSGKSVGLNDSFDVSDVSAGSTTVIWRASLDSTTEIAEVIRPTEGVGTSATQILDRPFGGGAHQFDLTVGGVTKNNSEHFTDRVLATQNNGVTVSKNSDNAESRTYGYDGTGVTLAVGAGTADVFVRGTVMVVVN